MLAKSHLRYGNVASGWRWYCQEPVADLFGHLIFYFPYFFLIIFSNYKRSWCGEGGIVGCPTDHDVVGCCSVKNDEQHIYDEW